MVGRYPDYDVLASTADWDAATRKVVVERLDPPADPSLLHRGAGADAARVLRRACSPRTPSRGSRRSSWSMRSSPPGASTATSTRTCPTTARPGGWCSTGLDATAAAVARHRRPSRTARRRTGRGSSKAFAAGTLAGEAWKELNVSRAWAVCTRMMLEAFYSHPWAWNEIGFGGPAYPQGYMRLGPVSVLEPRERAGATDEDPVRVAPRTART